MCVVSGASCQVDCARCVVPGGMCLVVCARWVVPRTDPPGTYRHRHTTEKWSEKRSDLLLFRSVVALKRSRVTSAIRSIRRRPRELWRDCSNYRGGVPCCIGHAAKCLIRKGNPVLGYDCTWWEVLSARCDGPAPRLVGEGPGVLGVLYHTQPMVFSIPPNNTRPMVFSILSSKSIATRCSPAPPLPRSPAPTRCRHKNQGFRC
jgi:hypothetical protein